MGRLTLKVLSSVVVLSLTACGEDNYPQGICEPGEQQSCACLYGVLGYQVCSADQSGWDACQCPNDGRDIPQVSSDLPEDSMGVQDAHTISDTVPSDTLADSDASIDCAQICLTTECGPRSGCDCGTDACGPSQICVGNQCQDPPDVVIDQKVVFLHPETLQNSLTSGTRTTLIGRTQAMRDQIALIKSGSVLVSEFVGVNESGRQFRGFLKKAIDVDSTVQDQVTFTEIDAKLTDAVISGSVVQRIPINASTLSASPSMFRSSAPPLSGFDLVNLDGTKLVDTKIGGVNALVEISEGSVRFDPQLEIQLVVKGGRVERFRVEVIGDISLDLALRALVTGSISNADFATRLWPPPASPPFTVTLTQFIGVCPICVPIVEVIELGLHGGVGLSASAVVESTAGVEASSRLSFGLDYQSNQGTGNWTVIADQGFKWDYTEPQFKSQATLDARVWIRPTVAVMFYGVLGPELEVEPALNLRALVPPFQWRLDAELGGRVSCNFEIPVLDIGLKAGPYDLFKKKWEIASGCGTNTCMDNNWTGGTRCDGDTSWVQCGLGTLVPCAVVVDRSTCESPRPFCAGSQCVQCLKDSDCGSGKTCSGNTCSGPTCSGVCCNADGSFKPSTTICNPALRKEFRCESTACGGDAQSRTIQKYCSGLSGACDGVEKEASAGWQDDAPCSTSQVCETDNSTFSRCKTCSEGCLNGSCVTATCGDGTCNGTETKSTCCNDCGCNSGYTCVSNVCKADCGNGTCESSKGETCSTCPGDCGCGSGTVCVSGQCKSCGAYGQPCCGSSCNTGFTCSSGTCGCASGQNYCSGSCRSNSAQYCGSSCAVCDTLYQSCSASGTCTAQCTKDSGELMKCSTNDSTGCAYKLAEFADECDSWRTMSTASRIYPGGEYDYYEFWLASTAYTCAVDPRVEVTNNSGQALTVCLWWRDTDGSPANPSVSCKDGSSNNTHNTSDNSWWNGANGCCLTSSSSSFAFGFTVNDDPGIVMMRFTGTKSSCGTYTFRYRM